ncbi:MAG: hypothetical protein AB8B79_12655 [Granulosicoccus sp.]
MKALNKTLLVAALTLSGTSLTAIAATQGNLGASSTGSSDVMIIKDNVVQLSGVGDLDLGQHNSTDIDLTANDDVCVFNSTATYSVTVESAGSAFELRNGAEAIPYSVLWTTSAAPATAMTHQAALGGNVGDRTSPNCNGGTNANFAVQVSSVDFNAAVPGTYTDTLTLMIEPE